MIGERTEKNRMLSKQVFIFIMYLLKIKKGKLVKIDR